ncbi:nuclease-related domain-containing protein [Streptomyces sp. NPDC046161]|uniref:nuclease-related domain-containing protein n=1 Tax=Streptomyces sp. NPDC046161 TaxID=3155132 RepID=UPI00340613F8
MRGLNVLPSGRAGRGRLFVNLPDGRAVAWYDRRTHRVSLLEADRREAVLEALRPYLSGEVAVGPPPVPTPVERLRLALPPDRDLAPNRPGEPLLGELAYGSPGTRARHRLRREAGARELMGAELDALEALDWRVLHAVPLPGGGLIDHLLIGPAGVFCVATVPGRRQRVRAGDLLLTVGRADPRPDVRRVRRAAAHAAHALRSAVTPVVAVVDAATVEVAPTLRDVRVLQPASAAPYFTTATATLKPPDADALFSLARDTRTWLP